MNTITLISFLLGNGTDTLTVYQDDSKTAITLTPPTVGRPSADLSADKMPDFSSFFIGRQFLGFGNRRPTIGRLYSFVTF